MENENKQMVLRLRWRWMVVLFLMTLPVVTMAQVYNQLNILPDRHQLMLDLQLPDLTGKVKNLYDHRKKVVLLTFFATWCPQCNSELSQLIHVQKKYQQKDFTVIAVSIDQDTRKSVQRWVAEKQLNYLVLHDQTYSTRNSHDVSLIPTVYLLDKNMKLAAKVVGEIDWQSLEAGQLIDSLLAERPDSRAGAESPAL